MAEREEPKEEHNKGRVLTDVLQADLKCDTQHDNSGNRKAEDEDESSKGDFSRAG